MSIQVFGGHGFVGSNYVRLTNHCVVNNKHDYTVDKTVDNIVYFISTISNYNVQHDAYLDINTNLITLIKILEQCKETNLCFNFISSWFVYGDTCVPAYEYSICNPKGFYSITKRTAELLLISYCETFKIKYRILRLANVIGGYDKKASKEKNALTFMIKELQKGNTIQLYDGGMIYRDYIHNNDVSKAINLILDKGSINSIYNISNGIPYLIKDILQIALSNILAPGQINTIDIPEFHKTVQAHNMWMNNDKLINLGYKPDYTIEDAVKCILNL